MNEIETGGPAFPVTINGPCECFGLEATNTEVLQFHGATLRDYFAAKAMQGMLSDLPKSLYGLDWMQKTTSSAYAVADSMLEARK